MEQGNAKASAALVWIDHSRKIVSFHEVSGFQRVEFSLRENMLSWMMELQEKCYRFQ